jgi:protein tyrosine/serine phosphatase
MNPPIPDSYWVVPGQLLAGEYPGSFRKDDARRKLRALLDAGIRSFLDLTETEDGLVAYDALATAVAAESGNPIRYRRMAIRDMGVPTTELMALILAHIDSELSEGRPIYVHCWGGIGRTGTVIGCYLVGKSALSGTQAIERIAELRRATPDGRRRSPETGEQCEFIASWPVRPATHRS